MTFIADTFNNPPPAPPIPFDQLPLSGVIRVAAEDLAKVEAKPKEFVVYMDDWIVMPGGYRRSAIGQASSRDYARCSVCLAGAVLAMTLNYRPEDKLMHPTYLPYSTETQRRIQALEFVRTNNFDTAVSAMYDGPLTDEQERCLYELCCQSPIPVYCPSYSAQGNVYYKALRTVADVLEAHGL